MIKPQDIAKGYFEHLIYLVYLFFFLFPRPQDSLLATSKTGERGPQETQGAFVSFEEIRG